jgi:hypothetical protein
VPAVGTSNPNGSSASSPGDHDDDRHRPERQLPQCADGEPAEHRADAEQHPVEAEQRARCVQVVGHVERQRDLDGSVQKVEEPGERQQPEQLGMGPQQRETAACGPAVDRGNVPRLRQPGTHDEYGEEHVGERVQAEHEWS